VNEIYKFYALFPISAPKPRWDEMLIANFGKLRIDLKKCPIRQPFSRYHKEIDQKRGATNQSRRFFFMLVRQATQDV
jgi:hypothetical protein